MAILKFIYPLALAALLSGCFETFDPGIDSKPVLCLNSHITAGEPITVEVTHSWMFNDRKSEENHNVNDATITILANGTAVDPDYLPREGDIIMISAESPTYGVATAEVTVPYATPVGNVRVIPTVTDVTKYEYDYPIADTVTVVKFNLSIEIDLDDPADIENFYNFDYNWFSEDDSYFDEELGVYWPGALTIGQFDYNSEPIFKEHVGTFETIMGYDDYLSFAFFTDRQFSGKKYTLHLNWTDNSFRIRKQEQDGELPESGINIFLSSVSHSYYNWAIYKWNRDDGAMGELGDIGLAESMWGYSNVSSGAGVVAASALRKITVDIRDLIPADIRN